MSLSLESIMHESNACELARPLLVRRLLELWRQVYYYPL